MQKEKNMPLGKTSSSKGDYPLISFIIVNYNTKELLDKCLENLIDIYPNMEIIVSDNASPDGSAELVRTKYLKYEFIKLHANPKNGGLAYASNIAYGTASGKYLVYLGTDAYPTKSAIEELVTFMESETRVGIVTPRLVLRDGTPDKDAHRGFPTPLTALAHFMGLGKLFPKSKLFGHYFLSYLNLKTRHSIDLCIAHFMMVRRECHEKVGLWDENFFLYGEDVDFCYRTKLAGYQIFYLGDIEVLHYKGAGVGRKTSADIKTASSASSSVKKSVPNWQISAMKLFINKHYSKIYPSWIIKSMFLGVESLLALRNLVRKVRS